MCTAITLESQSNEYFLGRTMDFSYDIMPQLFITPPSYTWKDSLTGNPTTDLYQFIGLGQNSDKMLGFFDGVNEKGVATATLYFAGYAKYDDATAELSANTMASADFIHYILGQCSSVAQLPSLLENASIAGVADPITNAIAPLHWIVADKSGACSVIEATDSGLALMDNPIGVMTNSPNFHWHMTNLRNYTEISPSQTEEVLWNNIALKPFGQGAGTSSLPGGLTSPERFIRAAYFKSHIPSPADSITAITEGFHILEGVSIPKGAILTARNTCDYTKYTALINISACEYYYKTYDDLQIKTASLW